MSHQIDVVRLALNLKELHTTTVFQTLVNKLAIVLVKYNPLK